MYKSLSDNVTRQHPCAAVAVVYRIAHASTHAMSRDRAEIRLIFTHHEQDPS
jgi:hypothetical protein